MLHFGSMSDWDKARKLKLTRYSPERNPKFCVSESIDPEINYFILMIEQLGGKPVWSCSGHNEVDSEFYIVFEYSGEQGMELARQLSILMDVEVIDKKDQYRLAHKYNMDCDDDGLDFEMVRNKSLKELGELWERFFGSLDFDEVVLDQKPGD